MLSPLKCLLRLLALLLLDSLRQPASQGSPVEALAISMKPPAKQNANSNSSSAALSKKNFSSCRGKCLDSSCYSLDSERPLRSVRRPRPNSGNMAASYVAQPYQEPSLQQLSDSPATSNSPSGSASGSSSTSPTSSPRSSRTTSPRESAPLAPAAAPQRVSHVHSGWAPTLVNTACDLPEPGTPPPQRYQL